MDNALPAADPASPWMKHLERAHALAHAAARAIGDEAEPNLHLEPAARLLSRGLAAMYDAFDGRADRVTAINLAPRRLWEAAVLVAQGGLPRALAALREACGALVGAEERFPLVPLAPTVNAPPLQGGRRPAAAPCGRARVAGPLVPRARACPSRRKSSPSSALPEPTTFAELAAAAEAARRVGAAQIEAHARARALPEAIEETPAEPPPEPPRGFAFVPEAPLDDDAFVRRWARECFEEVGMLGLQRAPLPGDDWRARLALERRLVGAVDAIAALGPAAVAYLEPLAMDAPVVNPMGVFAITMLGACLDGRDALAAAERVLHHFGPNDPGRGRAVRRRAQAGAEPVRPHRAALAPRAPPSWAAAPSPWRCSRTAGGSPRPELAALADEEDPRVLALALPALAVARHPDLGRALARALATRRPGRPGSGARRDGAGRPPRRGLRRRARPPRAPSATAPWCGWPSWPARTTRAGCSIG